MTMKLPAVTLSAEPLRSLLCGAVPAKLLLTAIELELFSRLGEPRTADAIAELLGTHPRNTHLFLDALAANDLVIKEKDGYQNAPLAATFLVKGQPTYLGDVLVDNDEWMQPVLDNLTSLVREGPPPASSRAVHSIAWPKEAEIRANFQRAGLAQWAATLVRRLPEFAGMSRMLDLGAGAGLIGLAIVSAHPTMTGVLFDRPEVMEVAKRFIREYGMEKRVSTLAGDYRVDAIGNRYDLVWTSYTLTRDTLDSVGRKIYEALNPGGVYVNLGEGLTQERTQPKQQINAMLSVGMTSGHEMLNQGEIGRSMLRVGFQSAHTNVVSEAQPLGSGVLDVARKAGATSTSPV